MTKTHKIETLVRYTVTSIITMMINYVVALIALTLLRGDVSSFRCKTRRLVRMSTKSSAIGHSSLSITDGIIIGGGRIGLHLYESNDKKDVLLTRREEAVPADSSGPIYVCTRNADLDNIIDSTPVNRRSDLVFLQNGILTSYLRSKGLQDNTQALIYFAVSKKGEIPIDGITELNPEGLTAVTGIWANDFKARLSKAGLTCHVCDKATWNLAMLEKHIWICSFMAVGVKHRCTVGEVASHHEAEIRALIKELVAAAASHAAVSFSSGVEDRLLAYARSVAHFPTALKEFEWRNGWFMDITFTAMSLSQADPCPLHTDLIRNAPGDLFNQALQSWEKRRTLSEI